MAIVGAGVSGIAMAVMLRRAGFERFTVFERSSGPGGTWFDNSYPGCEVDVASHAYQYPFFRYDWSRKYAPQDEILRYLEATIDRYGLRPRFRFGTTVERASWDDKRHVYDVRLANGAHEEFDAVVSCLGLLNNPMYPDWPGLDEFAGPTFHTARWEHEHDLRGRRVAVVGTGSTAAQVVPALAPIAGEVRLFQRSPTWIIPKGERDFGALERMLYRRLPVAQDVMRLKHFREREARRFRRIRAVDSPEQRAAREMLLGYLASEVRDPEVRRLLAPDYPVGCKRPVFASTFYAAFNHDNVQLVPFAVERVEADGVIDAAGVKHEVDVLVMATGFTPQQFLASLEVTGVDGRSIHDIWNGSASAFCGMTVPGIPNFFLLYGPNTNGGVSIMSNATRQAKAVVRALRRMTRTGATMIDTRPEALQAFVAWADARNAKRTAALADQCSNYYYAPNGRNVVQFPATYRTYRLMYRTAFPLGLVGERTGDVAAGPQASR